MKRLFATWARDEDASAAIEAGFLFPILMSILMGIVDLGMALNVNQKLVNSAHMVADLLAREDDITDAEMADAAAAGLLVVRPYSTEPMGYDVAGVQFLNAIRTPTVIWRDTFNMDPNGDVTVDSAGLGDQNEGVIAVTVEYEYVPFFTNFIVGEIRMQEVAYARGRKGNFVTRS